MNKKRATILGTGSYLPSKVLTNADLEKMVDTSDEWIVSRTGMKERRIASEEEHASFMGAEAAKIAIERSGIKKEDISCIVFATSSPDYLFPSSAALAQYALGLEEIPAFDCLTACTGFLYGLSIAKSYIESGMYYNVLLIAADKLSAFVDYRDRNTCILFGDGASAAVISSSDKKKGQHILEVVLGADGSLGELLTLPVGGSRFPVGSPFSQGKSPYISMEGKEVFKHAVRRMQQASLDCLSKLNLKETDIDWLVPHQANQRIIDAIAKRFALSDEKIFITVERYGNTAASSIGIALDELLSLNKVHSKEHLLLVGFGGGLSWGAAILKQV